MSLTDGEENAFLAALATEEADYIATLPAYVPQNIANTVLGYDLSCGDDLTELMDEVDELTALAQAARRRLSTPRGGVIDAPDYGIDLREYLHRGMTAVDIDGIPEVVKQELKKDERFDTVTVEVLEFAGDTFQILIRCQTKLGPFALTLDVTAAAVALTRVEV